MEREAEKAKGNGGKRRQMEQEEEKAEGYGKQRRQRGTGSREPR